MPENFGLSASEKLAGFLLEMSKTPDDETVSAVLKRIRAGITAAPWGTTPLSLKSTDIKADTHVIKIYGTKYLENLGYIVNVRSVKEVRDCINPYVHFNIDWENTERALSKVNGQAEDPYFSVTLKYTGTDPKSITDLTPIRTFSLWEQHLILVEVNKALREEHVNNVKVEIRGRIGVVTLQHE